MRAPVKWVLGILARARRVAAAGARRRAGLGQYRRRPGNVARLAAAQVPGLAIEGLSGPIPGRLGAARITLADRGRHLADGRGCADRPRPDGAASGTFRIERLEAARIALPRLPAASDTPAPPAPPSETVLPQLPSLPVAVALDHLGIGRLELGAPILQQDAAFSVEGNAALAAGALQAALDLQRLDAEGGRACPLARPGGGPALGEADLAGGAGRAS